MSKGNGAKEKPWALTTPSGSSEFVAWRDEAADPPALVVRVGKTELRYQLRCLPDLRAMLKKHGDWMLLGSADEQKPAADGPRCRWQPDHQGDDERGQTELDRRHKVGQQLGGDVGAGPNRATELERGCIDQEIDVLLGERPIQAERLAHLLDLLHAGLLAGQRHRRVPGMRCTARNTTVATPSSTGMVLTSRRKIYVRTQRTTET